MKKSFFTFLIFIALGVYNFYNAQSEIWGLNPSGGNGLGTLYGMPTGSTNISSQYAFTGNPGSNPQSLKLLEATNGKLYGMTNAGGPSGMGVIFEYDTLTNVYISKIDFTGLNGASPRGSLIQGANGKLYGMTQLGGTNNLGVIFEYNITTNVLNVLVNFSGTTGTFQGSQPYGDLIQPDNSSSKLYGLTRFGGVNDKGVLFEYDYNTTTYTNKLDFNGNTGTALGANPVGQMVKAVSASSSTTTLYGMAPLGGTNNTGVIFEYDYNLNVFTKKINLVLATGSGPQGSLFLASNGRLYGTTALGGASSGGTIFEYIISTNTYNKLLDLVTGAGSIGGTPCGNLIEPVSGKLYGMTRIGGSSNVGTLFEVDITNPALPFYTKKVDLATANGSSALGTLTKVSTGKLYGVTSVGGAASAGVLFQYNMASAAYTKKIDFNFCEAGNPTGALIQASNGKLYGLTSIGGTGAVGVIFEYDKNLGIYTKKINFTGNTGANPGSMPFGSLYEAGNGKLYGLTSAGGTVGQGTLFSYDVATGTHTKLVDFTGNFGTNPGGFPYGSLVQFSGNGKLYGVTKQGGSSNQGVIFEFDPVTNVYNKKIDLAAVNGYSVYGTVVETSGKLYGMAQLGGANSNGVIFEYDPTANIYTRKINFTGSSGSAQGSFPLGSLVTTPTVGILYGMTKTGGANDQGVIFEYNTVTNTYTKKYDMNISDGAQPMGSLIRAANGKLYGVTNKGGANSAGVLFEFDIATASYTKIMDFSTYTGNFPTYTQLLEICTKPLTPGSITASVNSMCAGTATSQSLSVSPVANATSYIWSLPSGSSITSSSITPAITADFSGVSAGTYSYSVAGINVCGTGTLSSASVTINALPVISVNSATICSGTSAVITPTGASTYSITGGNFTVSPLSTTSYSITGTSAEGCPATNVAVSSVEVNSLPVIAVNSGSICSGSSFTINPTGASTYTITGGTTIVSPLADETYSVSGTDANGCVSNVDAVSSVTVNSIPVIAVNSGSICAGNSFTINPSGASTYTITGGTTIVSPIADETYSVSGTDANGCVSNVDAVSSVTVNALPTIAVNSGSICSGNSFTINPSGASTYTITGGTAIVSPVADETYSVSGTDANGCVSNVDAVASVTVNALPTMMATTSNTLLCTGETATLSVTGSATSYTWSTTETTSDIAVTPTIQTTYTVEGMDANGCSNTISITQDVSLCTGIANLSSNNNSINVYPNPSNGLFVIDITTTSQVTITNALGAVVMSETMEPGKHTINIHDEATGIYFVKIALEGKQQMIKLIKQ